MIRNFIPLVVLFIVAPFCLLGQMRTIHKDEDSSLGFKNISLLSAKEGYFSTDKWIGYSTDSGKTLSKRAPSFANVIFSGSTTGNIAKFIINGVLPIDKQSFYVYGHLNHRPTYLISTDRGAYYTMLYSGYYNISMENEGFKKMCFINGTNTIVAIERNRIVKISEGRTLSVMSDSTRNYFDIAAPSIEAVYAISQNAIKKAAYEAEDWDLIPVPPGILTSICFINDETGWVGAGKKLYKTTTGGGSWTLVNDSSLYPLGNSMQFIDDNVGFCIGENYEILKTTDGGKIWEKLAGDIPPAIGQNTHRSIGVLLNELIWAGGDKGIIQLSTIAGENTLPAAKFYAEKGANIIKLKNKGKAENIYQWFKNGSLISDQFETTYTPSDGKSDTIKLIAKNGRFTDSLEIIVVGNTLPISGCSAEFNATTSGNQVSFVVAGNNSNTIYDWNFGDGIQARSTTSVDHKYKEPGNYLVKLFTTNTLLNCKDSSQQQIQIKDSLICPTVTFKKIINGSDSLTVTFIPNTSLADSAKYEWNFGDLNTSNITQPVHSFGTYGTYLVCVTQSSGNNCKTAYCDSITLSPPVVDTTQTGINCDSISIVGTIQSDLVKYSLIGVNSGELISANWDFGDGSTSRDLQPQHKYATLGQFQTCVTIATVSGCVKKLCDSISINSSGFRMASIYPNPVSTNQFILQYSAKEAGTILVELLTPSAARIRYDQLKVLPGINRFNFQLSDIRKGQYYFRITENGIISFATFMKI